MIPITRNGSCLSRESGLCREVLVSRKRVGRAADLPENFPSMPLKIVGIASDELAGSSFASCSLQCS